MKIISDGKVLEVGGGKDGFSPTVSTAPNETDDGTIVTITDASGEHKFEVLNGEDANQVYSTEEVRIGTWIDGKPLYRKVIVLKSFRVSTNRATTMVIDAADKTIINFSGRMTLSNGLETSIPISDQQGSDYVFVNSQKYGGSLILVHKWYFETEVVDSSVTIEYTKTTDEPEL